MSGLGPVALACAAAIRARRRALGLRQRDLADRVSERGVRMPKETVSKVERGARQITPDELVAVAAVLEASPGALLDGDRTRALS